MRECASGLGGVGKSVRGLLYREVHLAYAIAAEAYLQQEQRGHTVQQEQQEQQEQQPERSVQQSPEAAKACSKRARGRTRRLFPRCIGAKLWGRQFRYFTAGERDRFT